MSTSEPNNYFFDADIDAPAQAMPWDAEDESDLDHAAEGTYEYALIKSAPEVSAEECETGHASVEVIVRWGGDVLNVSHLTPPRPFFVGEEERPNLACDFLVPAERLGASRAPLCLVEADGSIRAVLLPGATGTLEMPGASAQSFESLIASGAAVPCPEHTGAHSVKLPADARVTMLLGGFEYEIASVRAGRKLAGSVKVDKKGIGFGAISAVVHVGMLAAMWGFMPPLGTTDAGAVSADDQYRMHQVMAALSERETEHVEELATDENPDNSPSGGTGARATGEEGKMGSEVSTATNKKWAVKKRDDGPQTLSRYEAIQQAKDFGMIGLLSSTMGDVNAPTSPWGAVLANGADAFSANGNMWGAELGEAAGSGALGLSGIGEGGGGRFEGIGLGSIDFGHGSGTCRGERCDGFGDGGRNLPTGTHSRDIRAPREAETTVSGRIPPEVIQRVVRQNFGRFRLCYQNALRNNPNLSGRVAVRFVIGRDGAVGSAASGGSDLPDAAVVSCVVRAFYGLSFPSPDGGIVTVTYPIVFSPSA